VANPQAISCPKCGGTDVKQCFHAKGDTWSDDKPEATSQSRQIAIDEETKRLWVAVGQFLQEQGMTYIKAHPPETKEDALRLAEIGVRIEREATGKARFDGFQAELDRAALDDATDHHDGGTPIPVPAEVASRLKARGFDLTSVPIDLKGGLE